MTLLQQIEKDMATAMRKGEEFRVGVLRLLKSALHNEQIRVGQPLGEATALKVLQKEAKQRKDSIAQYREAGREDLVASEQKELDLIQQYLPQQMDEEELVALVDKAVADTGASGPSDTGKVIGAVLKQAAGRADGAQVSRLVKDRLR